MNIDSYNRPLQKNQFSQEQQPVFGNYDENHYPTSSYTPSDAKMVGKPPIQTSTHGNANQLAQHVNKMSLQDEQFQHSQFASTGRPGELNGTNGSATGEIDLRSEQRPAFSAPPASATNHISNFNHQQFKSNTVLQPPPPPSSASGSSSAATFHPSSQNGQPPMAAYDTKPGQFPTNVNKYAPSLNPVGTTFPPHTFPAPATSPNYSSAATMPSQQQYNHANHIEQPAAPPAPSQQPPFPPSQFARNPYLPQPPPSQQPGAGAFPPSSGFPPGARPAAAPGPAPQPAQMANRGFQSYPPREHQPYPPTGYPPAAPAAYAHNHVQHQPMQEQPQRRLDPDQVPNPIEVMIEDQQLRGGQPFVTNQVGQLPPLTTTKFIVHDEGNASPRFIRSTMYSIPCGTDMMKQADIPFSLVITPFATLAAEEQPPPVVNTGALGPVRCVRCKAYVNSFMKFIDGGRRFACILCSAVTEVPNEYFQHLDHTGYRVDRYERPELLYGAYEFTVTQDYCKDSEIPNVPALIFLIDVSYNNVKSGFVQLLCENMVDIIRNNLPVDEQASEGHAGKRIRVGFVTYDTTVHFYNIKACLGQPQMMILGDTEDMFVPLVDGFLCDPVESLVVIDTLMRQIPTEFVNTRETDTLLLPAVKAGLEALKAAKCAGKLLLFHSSLPTGNAPGKLTNREDRKLLATDKEKVVLAPQNASYTNLAQECVSNGCSVDLFILNNSHVDLATVGQLSKITGGEIFKYTYFQANIDGDRLLEDVKRNLRREIAFDAVMRVRTSTGVRPVAFYGHMHMTNTTDIELASINADKSVAVEVKHDDKLNEEDMVFIQVAILYTSCCGERRVRILNMSLLTCTQLADMFRNCELDTLVNYWSKAAVAKILEGTPRQVRESLVNRSVRILACYRKLCANPSPPGQLILPECMKLLPLYLNCLLKSDAIFGGSDMTVDDRLFMMQSVSIMDVPTSVNYFYPRLVPLVYADPTANEMPPQIRCTSYKLSSSEAYLLENGIYMFLWLGSKLPNEWLGNVFGSTDASLINANLFKLPEFDNVYSKKVHSLIARMQKERRRTMRLTIVREQDKMEIVFRRFLVEDGTTGVAAGSDNFASAPYVDFLCQMHKEIRNTLS